MFKTSQYVMVDTNFLVQSTMNTLSILQARYNVLNNVFLYIEPEDTNPGIIITLIYIDRCLNFGIFLTPNIILGCVILAAKYIYDDLLDLHNIALNFGYNRKIAIEAEFNVIRILKYRLHVDICEFNSYQHATSVNVINLQELWNFICNTTHFFYN